MEIPDICGIKDEMKEKTEKFLKENSLPSFEELAEDFDIEEILEKETDHLARELRRIIVKKLSAYLQLFDSLVNPASAPQGFVFTLIKNLNEDERKSIKEVYKELTKMQIRIMKLDTIYSEKEEIQFIKDSFKLWQDLKVKSYKLLESFEKDVQEDNSNGKSYFG